jgi:hypothetical protein
MYQQAAFADHGGDKSLLRSEIERDLVTLKPHEIIGKYGEEIGSDMSSEHHLRLMFRYLLMYCRNAVFVRPALTTADL